MRITVFGATGMVGKYVVQQALATNYRVTAFGRNIESLIDAGSNNEKLIAIKGHVFDEAEVYNAVKDTDAVISVLGGAFDGTDRTRSLGIKNIITQMQKANVSRIIALGGMGILNGEDGELLLNSPTYPQEYIPVGREHEAAYNYLRTSNLAWTFVCSPDIIDANTTEHFVTNKDHAPIPNNFKITAGDLAFFMLHELHNNAFVKHRVGISN